MNGSWGYRITDRNYKSTDELIRYLAGAAGRGGNLLLNIGPQPDGALPDAALERLAGIGDWMRRNAATICGTEAGPVTPRAWGVTTRCGERIYVHILDWPDTELFVPIRGMRVRKAANFADRMHKISGGVLPLPRFSFRIHGTAVHPGPAPDYFTSSNSTSSGCELPPFDWAPVLACCCPAPAFCWAP